MPCARQARRDPGQHVARSGSRQEGWRIGRDRSPAVGRRNHRVGTLDEHHGAVSSAARRARSSFDPT